MDVIRLLLITLLQIDLFSRLVNEIVV